MSVPVTCIIPTFNRIRYLGEAIESVLRQTTPPERVLVVDDGSTDTTASLVRAFKKRVDYLFKTNGGKSSALNVGLNASTSPYIWIFDDDDVADEDALERMYAPLAADDEIGFTFGPYRIFEIEGDRKTIFGPETLYFPIVEDRDLLVAQLRHSFVHQPGLLVRKRCYDEVGPFDEAILRSQDYEMMLRLSRSFVGKALEKPLFSQRRHTGARGTSTLRIAGKDVQQVWKRFDQEIVSRAYARLGLAEFLSKQHCGCDLSSADEISARLERAAVMGRRGLWDVAIDDLRMVLQLAVREPQLRLRERDRDALKRLFDRYGDGLAELMPVADRLAAVLAAGRRSAIGRELPLYLAWGLPRRLAVSLAKGRVDRVRPICRALAATLSFRLPWLLARLAGAAIGSKSAPRLT